MIDRGWFTILFSKGRYLQTISFQLRYSLYQNSRDIYVTCEIFFNQEPERESAAYFA